MLHDCFPLLSVESRHSIVIEMLIGNLLVHFMDEVVFVSLFWISNCLCFSAGDDLSMAKEAYYWDKALIIWSNLLNFYLICRDRHYTTCSCLFVFDNLLHHLRVKAHSLFSKSLQPLCIFSQRYSLHAPAPVFSSIVEFSSLVLVVTVTIT